MLKTAVFLLLTAIALHAAQDGSSVLVIYNSKSAPSKQVAEYYAQKRQVPAGQVMGFELPATETITRQEYVDQLQDPLVKRLEKDKLFTFDSNRRVLQARIRYAVLCYGVPTRILKDTKLVEQGTEKMEPALNRNEASVDSQLAVLPALGQKLNWAGPLKNPVYATTTAAHLNPTNLVLMVTRLDGPSVEIAKGLVDKALEADAIGLWGRAYIDLRGLNDGPYKIGDDWIKAAGIILTNNGFLADFDTNSTTFPASYPMNHIGFYAGWYDAEVSGPFTLPEVEFMPGAIAYHLHSFSAQSIRTTNAHWVGPLLAKGVTCTFGNVDEPYLGTTIDIGGFTDRFLRGFTFGEAAYAASDALSWQGIIIGDPLYAPFALSGPERHAMLEKQNSVWQLWSALRFVNINLARPDPDLDHWINYLEKIPIRSSILKERLADLYWANKKYSDALETYEEVLKLQPSRQQMLRVLLTLGQRRAFYGPEKAALQHYQIILKEFPNYSDLLGIYKKALPLAQKLGEKELVAKCEAEIKRLSATPPPKP